MSELKRPPVEHFDFGFVEKCTSVEELKSIQEGLESQEYGIYPDLEKFVHERLMKVMTPAQRHAHQISRGYVPEEDRDNGKAMAVAYVQELHKADESIKSAGTAHRNLPPVRGTPVGSTQMGSSTSSKVAPVKQPVDAVEGGPGRPEPSGSTGGRVEAKAATLASQYDKWSKFDVESAIAAGDKEMAQRDAERQAAEEASRAARKSLLSKLRLPANLDELSPAVVTARAASEKGKGNESFKAKDYEEAVVFYSRSLACDSTSPAAGLVFSNRSQAHLYLKHWGSAEEDASAALSLVPKHPKSLSRRGEARMKRGKYSEAAEDFSVLLSGAVEAGDEGLRGEAEKKLREARNKLGAEGGASPAVVNTPIFAPPSIKAPVKVAIEAEDEEEEEEEEEVKGGKKGKQQFAVAAPPPTKPTKLVIIEGEDSGEENEMSRNDVKTSELEGQLKCIPPSSTAPQKEHAATPPSSQASVSAREAGNAHLMSGRVVEAIEEYKRALTLAPSSDLLLKAAALSNLSAAELKLGGREGFQACVAHSGEALVCYGMPSAAVNTPTPGNGWTVGDVPENFNAQVIKCLFRRGSAARALGDLAGALRDLTLATELEPSNDKIVQEIREIKALQKSLHHNTTATAATSTPPPLPPQNGAGANRSAQGITASTPPSKPATAASTETTTLGTKTKAAGVPSNSSAPPPKPPQPTAAAISTVAAAALAAAAARKSDQLSSLAGLTSTPPRTATEFETRVSGFKKDTPALFSYLRAVLEQRGLLPSLFKSVSMDVDVVSRVLGALGCVEKEGGEWALGVLADMASTKGFTMTSMMLEAADLDRVRAVVKLTPTHLGTLAEAVSKNFGL